MSEGRELGTLFWFREMLDGIAGVFNVNVDTMPMETLEFLNRRIDHHLHCQVSAAVRRRKYPVFDASKGGEPAFRDEPGK